MPQQPVKVFAMNSESVSHAAGDDIEKQLVGKFSTSSAFRKKMTPQDIIWDNVNFSVKGKSILQDNWGSVPAGNVAAIMGPSGAGKSSLLNVLAGRSAPAPGITITGHVEVAGKKINPVAFRENIAYVMQEDALMPTATPREALWFSAKLRLPNSTTNEEIDDLVNNLLKDLGLESCADTLIGGALIKGISGGQKKRTSVGVELITDPALLFLDEPTSGLDSFSAYNMVQLLKSVSESNSAVLCTIHQPSSEVFFLFDILIFLKAGRVFYQGPPKDLIAYLSKGGFNCPSNYNPSDYIMFVSELESVESLEEKKLLLQAPEGLQHKAAVDQYNELVSFNVRASFGKQLYYLCYRELLNTKRDTAALAARFGITITLNLLFGLIFLNAGGKDDSDPVNFSSHFGAITMILIASMFGPAQSVMLAFPFERPLFMREYATGTYGAITYFMSKVALELPLTFVQSVVQYIIVYFMVDMQGSWIYITLAAWGLGVASCSVAMMLGCMITEVKDVAEMAPMLFVPQLLFAGFFIRTSQIPIFLRWAQYLCAIKYTINLVLLTEFSPSNKSCQDGAAENCAAVLQNNDVKAQYVWLYIIILVALFVGFRGIGAAILIQKAKRFY